MEYAEGKELFDYIVLKKRLSEMEACKLYQEIIDGIEYLHIQNIVHRDLKPENLLLDHKKSIKISDFGLSTIYSNDKLLKTPCGTPSYAPPEMLKGQKYHGLLSDIWSSGVILFAMVCGYLPFSESKEEMVIRKIVQGNYEIPDHVSPLLKDFMKNVLKQDPLERYDLEQIKEHPWFNIMKPNFCPGLIVGYHNIPLDEAILCKIEEYGYDKEKTRQAIQNNKFDTMTAIYNLCLRKFVKEGGKSISDMFSSKYKNYMMSPQSLLSNNKKQIKSEEEVDQEMNKNKSDDSSKFKRKKNDSNRDKDSSKDIKEVKDSNRDKDSSKEVIEVKNKKSEIKVEDMEGNLIENLKPKHNVDKNDKYVKTAAPAPEDKINNRKSKASEEAKKENPIIVDMNTPTNNKNYDLPLTSNIAKTTKNHERKSSVTSNGNNNLDLNFFKIISSKGNKEKKVILIDKSNIDKYNFGDKTEDLATTITKETKDRKDVSPSPKVNVSTIQKMDSNKNRNNYELPLKTDIPSTTRVSNTKNPNSVIKYDEFTERNSKSPGFKIISTESHNPSSTKSKKSNLNNISSRQDSVITHNNVNTNANNNANVSTTEALLENCRKQNEDIAKLLKETVNPMLKLRKNYCLPRQIDSAKTKIVSSEVASFLKINPESIIKNTKNLSSHLKQGLKNYYSHNRSSSHNNDTINKSINGTGNQLEMTIKPKNRRKTSEIVGNDVSGLLGMYKKYRKNETINYKNLHTDNSLIYNKIGNANKRDSSTGRVNQTERVSDKNQNHEREYRKIQPKTYSNSRQIKKKFLDISTHYDNELDHRNETSGERSISNTKNHNRQLSFSPSKAVQVATQKNKYNINYLKEKNKQVADILRKQRKLTPNKFKKTTQNAVNYKFAVSNNISTLRKKDSVDTKTTDILSDEETPANKTVSLKNSESVDTRHVKSNSNMSDTFSNRLNHNTSTDRHKYQKRTYSKDEKPSYGSVLTTNNNINNKSIANKSIHNKSINNKKEEKIDKDDKSKSNRDSSINNQISFSEYNNNFNFPLKKVIKNNNYNTPKIIHTHFNEKSDKDKHTIKENEINTSSRHNANPNNNSFFNTTNYNTTIIINNQGIIPTKEIEIIPTVANTLTNHSNILKTEVNTTRNNNNVIKIGDNYNNVLREVNSGGINSTKNASINNQQQKNRSDRIPDRSGAMMNNYLFKNKQNEKYDKQDKSDLGSVLNTVSNSNLHSENKKSVVTDKIKHNLGSLNHNNLDEFFKVTTTPSSKSETAEQNDNMKFYIGPIDINCIITIKNISAFIEKLMTYLKKKKLSVVQQSAYRIKCICSQSNLNFDVELFKMEGVTSNYIRFRKFQGEYSEYRKLCNQIMGGSK